MKFLAARLITVASHLAGTTEVSLIAIGTVILYIMLGFIYRFSEAYQMSGNTIMSAVSYIMLFILQATQNRETKAMHLKMDELIRVQQEANNFLIGIEDLTEEQLGKLSEYYRSLRDKSV